MTWRRIRREPAFPSSAGEKSYRKVIKQRLFIDSVQGRTAGAKSGQVTSSKRMAVVQTRTSRVARYRHPTKYQHWESRHVYPYASSHGFTGLPPLCSAFSPTQRLRVYLLVRTLLGESHPIRYGMGGYIIYVCGLIGLWEMRSSSIRAMSESLWIDARCNVLTIHGIDYWSFFSVKLSFIVAFILSFLPFFFVKNGRWLAVLCNMEVSAIWKLYVRVFRFWKFHFPISYFHWCIIAKVSNECISKLRAFIYLWKIWRRINA